jgi:hypothetical protein
VTLTDEQILDMSGTRTRTDRWRWEVTDLAADNVLGELHPSRDGAPRMTNGGGGRLGRTLTGLRLTPSEAADIDPVRTCLRPVLILANGSEYPMGVFRWADTPEEHRSWGVSTEPSLVDRTTILDQETTRTYSWPRGTLVTAALDRIIGEVLPDDQYVITPSPEILHAPESHPIGSSRLSMISSLVDKLTYLPPHFVHTGVLLIRPTPDPNLAAPAVVYAPGSRVVAGTVTGGNTLLDTPNVYVVYDTSASGAGIRGVYHVPDEAPHSRTNRGHLVPMTRAVQGLASYQQAQFLAAAMAVIDGRAYTERAFRAPIDPRHDQWTVVEYEGTRWLEQGWDAECSPTGTMGHLLRQVYTESWVPPT